MVEISAEVKAAVEAGRPVVALESALITHGLPRPTNLECARRLEEAVREEGALPATCGVLAGRLVVGLNADETAWLAEAEGVRKYSIRNLGSAAACGESGGSTVAATLFMAAQAGISIMATGGIGGVHRGDPFDISADLPCLASMPMLVVCAGAKAILDLRATREWLETHNVLVAGYGVDELPGFYCRETGLPVDTRINHPAEAAAVFAAHRSLNIQSAIVIGNPPPVENALPRMAVDSAVHQALEEMERRHISGPAVTPFLLGRVSELTGGESMATNLALLESNARLAAQIAVAFAALPRQQ